MAGPTILVSADWITFYQPEKTSTYWFWIRKFIPIPADKNPSQHPLVPVPNIPLKERPPARKTLPCRLLHTALLLLLRFPWALMMCMHLKPSLKPKLFPDLPSSLHTVIVLRTV